MWDSGIGTKSILRGRGELEARRAEQPEPGAGGPGDHRHKLVKKKCGGPVEHSNGGADGSGVWGGGIPSTVGLGSADVVQIDPLHFHTRVTRIETVSPLSDSCIDMSLVQLCLYLN